MVTKELGGDSVIGNWSILLKRTRTSTQLQSKCILFCINRHIYLVCHVFLDCMTSLVSGNFISGCDTGAISIQFIFSQPISQRYILILSSYSLLGLPIAFPSPESVFTLCSPIQVTCLACLYLTSECVTPFISYVPHLS